MIRCLPHARGGVSHFRWRICQLGRSSPRTWGCFHGKGSRNRSMTVFPTHVGVFLLAATCVVPSAGLPHARGGVSDLEGLSAAGTPSSPRTWGCFLIVEKICKPSFVFPTHVGVFLHKKQCNVSDNQSSPRTWGCFQSSRLPGRLRAVFPTHVGVFPQGRRSRPGRQRSSPRTWGCFCI